MIRAAAKAIHLDSTVDNWASELGRKYGVREKSTARTAHAAHERAEQMSATAQARWTPIVEAIRSLVAGYNAGAAYEVLKVVEERSAPGGPVVRVGTGGEGEPFLSATLEGQLICVRTRDGQGTLEGTECSLSPDRSDDRTAAYLMQNWLARL